MINKAIILKAIDEEIEFAKGCGMPQFVMGLLQAKKVIEEMEEAE
jgi:hypothetical protein